MEGMGMGERRLPYNSDIVTIIKDDPLVTGLLGSLLGMSLLSGPPIGSRAPKQKKRRNPKKSAQKAQRMARKANR
jgi:hypothetical protein